MRFHVLMHTIPCFLVCGLYFLCFCWLVVQCLGISVQDFGFPGPGIPLCTNKKIIIAELMCVFAGCCFFVRIALLDSI